MSERTPTPGRWPRALFKLYVALTLAYFAVCLGLLLSDPFRIVELRPLLAFVRMVHLPLGLCLSFYFFAGDPTRTGARNAGLAFVLVVLHSFVVMPRLVNAGYQRWMHGASEAALIQALGTPETDAMIPHFAAVELGRRGPAARGAAAALATLAADPTRTSDLRLTASEALKSVAVPAAVD